MKLSDLRRQQGMPMSLHSKKPVSGSTNEPRKKAHLLKAAQEAEHARVVTRRFASDARKSSWLHEGKQLP